MMYKYTQVLFFLGYFQGVFCWNSYRIPNSISDFKSYPELNPLDDDNSESYNWVSRNIKKTHFNEGPHDDYSSRITFPDDDNNNDSPSNNRYKDENTHSQHFILKCIRSCPVTNEFSPVCGNDDITYYNLDLLECVRECGDDVQLRHLSPCEDSSEVSTQPPTTTKSYLDSCLSICPTTSEYNPVCGTDNVTYKNIGKLNCAQICGVGVEVKRRLPCPKKTLEDLITTEDPIETTTINSRYFQSCMDSCLTTTEYKPVCASNGKTYFNNGKFQCAKSCGLNISIQASGVCEINQSGEFDTLSSTTTTTTTTPLDVHNKQPVTTIENLLDKIFNNEDTGDPELDVRHS